MKLRHALTAVAAAAVIAPAVPATPAAASATESPSPSAHTNKTEKTDGTKPGPDAKPGRETGTKPSADARPAKENGTQPSPDARPAKEKGTKPGTKPGGTSSADTPPDEPCASTPKHLQMAIKGLQSAFIAGADWSHSSLTVTSTSDKAMEKVRPRPYISSSEIVDRPYEELEAQFRNPVTGKWLSFEDATTDSEFTGFPVAAHRTVTLPLRIRAINSAKPGAGYAIVEGTFANQDGSCGTSNHEQYNFKILPAHGNPGRPSTPGKPSESAAPGGGAADGPKPQGGVQKTSGVRQLAATGSPSALPTIALVSGVAMAVGAGAILGVRRRRAAAGSGDGTGAAA
ncbi:cell wall protein [Streptomyces sp. C10]|uniref:cell wall protein n=1 Tax=Streptomyces sp. C10 TaxID=531941 RepID=UPI0039804C1C